MATWDNPPQRVWSCQWSR